MSSHHNTIGSSESASSRGKIENQRFLVFTLCDEEFAIPLLKVKEVIAPTAFTPVPHMPAYCRGIMNLRGLIISVIDLRMKLKMKKADKSNDEAIIIIDFESQSFGMIVDSVKSVLSVASSEIKPAPNVDSSPAGDNIVGVTKSGDKLVLILDIEKTLGVSELKTVSKHFEVKNKVA